MECPICIISLAEDAEVATPQITAPPPPKRTRRQIAIADRTNTCSTPCGHIFHRVCINSWFDRGNNTCPSCRKDTTRRQLKPVYLTGNTSIVSSPPPPNPENNPAAEAALERGTCQSCEQLQAQVDTLKKEKAEAVESRAKAEKERDDAVQGREKAEREKGALKNELDKVKAESVETVRGFMDQVNNCQKQVTALQMAKEEAEGKLKEYQEKGEHSNEEQKRKAEVEIQSLKTRLMNSLNETTRLKGLFAQEKRNADQDKAKLANLQQRFDLLVKDLDRVTVNYLYEQDKNLLMQGKVASLESELVAFKLDRGMIPSPHGSPNASPSR